MNPAERDDIAAAFAEDRARQLRSRAEYRAHPHAGNYSGLRQPCHGCGKPTYSKHATCNNCVRRAHRRPREPGRAA
jgi:hypothetical protein